MRTALLLTISLGVLFVSHPPMNSIAYAQTNPPSPSQSAPPPPSGPVVVAREITTQAVIEDVDPQTHQVLLRLPDNSLVTLKVGSRAGNLADLKPGDHITAHYIQAKLINIEPMAGHAGALQTIAGGQGDTMQGGTTVVAVDPSGHTVSFVGPGNVVQTIHVAGNARIEAVTKLHPGDRADVAYTPAIAVSLHAA